MQRRDSLKSSVAGALKVGVPHAQKIVHAHNWDKYDFGSGLGWHQDGRGRGFLDSGYGLGIADPTPS